MSCEDIPSLLDLQKVKKHADDFGRLMGTGTGTSTNGVTGQVRPTYNKVIVDLGFKPGSGDFTTGFTVMPGERDIAWYDPVSLNWYSYLGVIPTGGYPVAPGTNPVGDSEWKPRTDQLLRNEVFVRTKTQLLSNLADDTPANITSDLDGASFDAAESAILLLKLNLVSSSSKVTLYVDSLSTTTTEVCNVGSNGNVTISGSAPIATTLASVAEVAGSSGNFSVTYNVASAAGMAVGDVLCLDEVLPARLHFSTGITGVRKPVLGEMAVGFNFMGAITVSGVTCTVTSGNCPTYLTVGDLVHIQGQTRVIQTISASSFTIDTALDYSPSGFQWWYFSRPATGTVAISGVNITGTGTSFLTEYDAGDIMVVDGMCLRVVTITSNIAMTTTHNVTVAAGAAHSVYKAGLLHEGGFLITAIAGNQVTVKNTSRLRKPPKNLITCGRVRCLKTVLRNDVGNGFVFGMGSVLGGIKDLALVSAGVNNVALALNGFGSPTGYNKETGQARLLGAAAVVGWGRGAFLAGGAVLIAEGQFIGGCAGNAVECTDGGDAYLRNARVHGAGGIGALVSGGFARTSSAAFIGNGLQGTRQDVVSGIYGDTWYTWGNVSHGAMQVNSCAIQFVDGVTACNGGDGVNAQNSASGRLSRMLFAANGVYGMNMTGILHEATQAWVTGHPASRNGVVASRARIDLRDSAQTGNGANGVYALQSSTVTANNSVQRSNGSYGARADDVGTSILLNSGFHGNNTSGNVHHQSGGVVAYDLNPLGTRAMGSHYSEVILISDDAVAKIYVGMQTVMLSLVSSNSNTLQGLVRARVGSDVSSAIIAATGIVVSTGVLAGITGADGDFTISPALDGYLYLENRTGSAKTVIIDVMGRIL